MTNDKNTTQREAYERISSYVPGQWFDARTLDEMQAFYLSRLPAIRAAAQEHGYAIGLHGSTRRDFDLMAMQWREDASDKDALAHAIAEAACGIRREGAYDWERKPSGRFAVSIPICWTDHGNPEFGDMISLGHIDLSVIEARAAIDPSASPALPRVSEQATRISPVLVLETALSDADIRAMDRWEVAMQDWYARQAAPDVPTDCAKFPADQRCLHCAIGRREACISKSAAPIYQIKSLLRPHGWHDSDWGSYEWHKANAQTVRIVYASTGAVPEAPASEQQALRDGYQGSTMVSDFQGPKITLRYATSAQADTAHEALCKMIDATPAATTASTTWTQEQIDQINRSAEAMLAKMGTPRQLGDEDTTVSTHQISDITVFDRPLSAAEVRSDVLTRASFEGVAQDIRTYVRTGDKSWLELAQAPISAELGCKNCDGIGACPMCGNGATTASASFQKFGLTNYSLPVTYSNGTGRAPAPSRNAAPVGHALRDLTRAVVERLGWTINGTFVVTKSGEMLHTADGIAFVHAALTQQSAAQAPTEAEYLSKRLARVAKLAGAHIPEYFTHEQVAGIAPTILGVIARNLERAAQAAHAGADTERDAARYRFLRKGFGDYGPDVDLHNAFVDGNEKMDAAIDAAMSITTKAAK